MSIPDPDRARLSKRLWMSALAILLIAPPAPASDRIVLRNTTVISDRSVLAFNPDRITLSGNPPMTLGWHEIEQARLENPQNQQRFQAMLDQLGDPLYRIRLRLKTGDYRDITPLAEKLFPIYQTRRSPTAYLVFQSLVWSRLAQNQRPQALAPWILAVECLRADPDHAIALPGDRKPKVNLSTGLSPDLTPVWFDPKNAKQALPQTIDALKTVKPPVPPGLQLSAASLAIEAGDASWSDRLLSGITSDARPVRDLLLVLQARRAILENQPDQARKRKTLESAAHDPAFSQRPLALYWLGLQKTRASKPSTQRLGVLDLLTLPAAYADEDPQLAAAGLYQAWKTLESLEDPSAAVLRSQLSSRFGASLFGQRLASEMDARRESAPNQEQTPQRP